MGAERNKNKSHYDGISYEDTMRLAHAKLDFLKMQRSIERRACELEGDTVLGYRVKGDS